MAKENNNSAANEISAAVSLSVRPCDGHSQREENALAACERFFQAASLIPEREFLGWQVSAEKGGAHRVLAFSSAGARAAGEDLAWIFAACAAAENTARELSGPLCAGRRWVYALRAAETSPAEESGSAPQGALSFGDFRSWEDDSRHDPAGAHFRDLLALLGSLGGALCVLAGRGTEDGLGTILVGLPDEMTLRTQAALSLAFPGTAAAEIPAADPLWAESGRLPSPVLAGGMRGLLELLMSERPEPERPAGPPEHSGAPKTSTSEEPEDLIPIEDLDLSVRSFNCLKRAGINTLAQLRGLSDEDLSHVRNLGRKCIEEIKRKLAGTAEAAAPVPLTAASYTDMLDELTGLGSVKEQVRRIAAFAKLRRAMAAQDRAPGPLVLNMVFTGNPGTAKTTVARIMAGILHEAGLLTRGGLIETGRADLVARYEGQTADKVKAVFRQSKGKVLFIDEAYSLVDCQEGTFGDEAISTIVQEMENNRADTVVIFAGYPDKMEDFFARNPGLRSRVPFQIHFEDYSAGELAEITRRETAKRGFALRPGAEDKVAAICREAAGRPELGNGRFCRNLVESAVLSYAARVYGRQEEGAPDFALEGEDFCLPGVLQKPDRPAMGFLPKAG